MTDERLTAEKRVQKIFYGEEKQVGYDIPYPVVQRLGERLIGEFLDVEREAKAESEQQLWAYIVPEVKKWLAHVGPEGALTKDQLDDLENWLRCGSRWEVSDE